MFRVVLDTNQVVAAGTKWLVTGAPSADPNTSRRILINVAEKHTGLYCGKIIGEYLEKLVDRNHPSDRAMKLIAYVMGAFERVQISTESVSHPPADADDTIFIICAIDGSADYLVSDDTDILDVKAYYSKPHIGQSAELVRLFEP
jgi:predicted nucleic acid-binding protein